MNTRFFLPLSDENKIPILYVSRTSANEPYKAVRTTVPNLEFLFITGGSGELNVGGSKIPVTANDLVILNENTNSYCTTDAEFSFYTVGIFIRKHICMIPIKKKYVVLPTDTATAQELASLFCLMFVEASTKEFGYMEIISHSFFDLSILARRIANVHLSKIRASTISSDVDAACYLLDNLYNLPLSVEEIAKRLYVSPSYISHKFKQEKGISIIQYKIAKQLKEARNLLYVTDMSVTEIVNAVGFSDASYFSKAFKKDTGMTPREFRKKGRANIK